MGRDEGSVSDFRAGDRIISIFRILSFLGSGIRNTDRNVVEQSFFGATLIQYFRRCYRIVNHGRSGDGVCSHSVGRDCSSGKLCRN